MLERGRYRRTRRGDWDVWADRSSWREEWWPIVERQLAKPGETLRESRHARTSTLSLPRDGGIRTAFLKVYHRTDWRADVKNLWRRSRALHALRMNGRLADDGFSSPPVIAAGEQRRGRLLQGAFLLTAEVAWPTLVQLGQRLASLPAAEGRRRRRAVIEALAAEVGRFHRAGYVHGDLVIPNILVEEGPPVRFCFLDHDRSRKRSSPALRMQCRDLVELNRLAVPGVRHSDRYRFFVRYADVRGWPREEARDRARRVAQRTRARVHARERKAAGGGRCRTNES